jgi:hypothetical protein
LVRFPACFLIALVLATIPGLFALRQGDFDFCFAVAEINSQRNNRQTFRIGTPRQFVYLALVKQKLAVAQRFMVPRSPGEILRNMRIHQKRPARFEIDESVSNVGFSLPQSFYFCPVQHQTGFKLLKYVVIVGSGAILRHDEFARSVPALFWFLVWLGHNLSFYLMPRLNT